MKKVEYLKILKKQYMRANGLIGSPTDYKNFDEGFNDWLNNLDSLGKEYLYTLDYLRLNIFENNIIEVGKSYFDSAAKDLNLKILTPYTENFDENTNKIIKGNLILKNGYVLLNDGFFSINLHALKPRTFMIQNPSSVKELKPLAQLHNTGDGSIIIGVYGNREDRDRNRKVNQLYKFKKYYLDKNTEMYNLETEDNYHSIVLSKSLLSKYSKTKF